MDRSSSRSDYGSKRRYEGGGPRAPNVGRRGRENSRKSSSAPREPSQVQIFIEGLPLNAKIPDLVDYFSTVGKIKIDREANKPRVWLYHDKQTGDPTGEATITYHDNETQKRALDKYNGQMFHERYEIKVTPSIVKPHMAKPPPPSSTRGQRGRGSSRGLPRGGGGHRGRGESRERGRGFGRGRGRDFGDRDQNSSFSRNQRQRNDYSSPNFQNQGDRISNYTPNPNY